PRVSRTAGSLEQQAVLKLLPCLLWREVIIETQEVKHVASSLPGITIPVWIIASKDLKAGTHITPVMMLLEGTGANSSTIQSGVATEHRHDILSLTPYPNSSTTRSQTPLMACRRHIMRPAHRHRN